MAVLKGRTVWLPGSGNKRNMVAVADVAEVAVRALTEEGLSRRTIEIGGPDNLTEREVAELYGRLSGKPVKVRTLSPTLLRALAAMAGPFHAGIRNLITFMLEMEREGDLSFDASAVPELLGRPPTTIEAAARRAIANS